MRIAMFTDMFLPINSGVATSIMNSARWLADRGHEVMIFAPYSEKAPSNLGKNIHVHYCKPMKNFRFLNYKDLYLAKPELDVFRKIKRFKPDVIHSHTPSLIGWTAMLCSKIYHIPMVGTYHGFLQDFLEHISLPRTLVRSELAKQITWNYARQYFNRCDLIIVPSSPTKVEVMKNGFLDKVKVVSNGINLHTFNPKDKKKNGRTILHVGRLSYEKNIDVVIRAFKRVVRKNPNANLVIIGTGPQEGSLKRMCGKLLGKQIKFVGYIAHNKLAEHYSRADIFVTASTIETEGLVILEAMACGLPIVGVDVRAIPFVVKDNENGLIAEAGNEHQIAACIEKLLDNGRMRVSMGRKSVAIARNYSIEKTCLHLENEYRLLARRIKPGKRIYFPFFVSNKKIKI